jgi:PadR family transcriptional regulator AphA
MSLRHALLGLLAQGPASGYDLTRTFDGSLGRYAWQAGHSRIYPELNKMADAGLVVVDETGPRGRKTYALTDDGRTELRRWMLHWPEQTSVRDETVLRMFLVQSLDPPDARRLLEGIAAYCARERETLRAMMDEVDAEHDPREPVPFGRLAGEYGVRQFEAVHGWALWSLERLAATVPS